MPCAFGVPAGIRRPTRRRPPAATGANRLAIGTATTFSKVDGVFRVGGRDGGGRGCGRTGFEARRGPAEQVGLQVLGELPDQAAGHVGQHAATELGGLTGDGQVRGDENGGGVTLVLECSGDDGRGVAATPRLLPVGLDDDTLRGRILLLERRFALVGHGDRADLHLHRAGELVTVDGQQLRAGNAGRDPLDVGEHLPRLGRRNRDSEFVVQLHYWRLLDEGDDGGWAGG